MRKFAFFVALFLLVSGAARAEQNLVTGYHKEANGDVVVSYGDTKKTVTLRDVDAFVETIRKADVGETTNSAKDVQDIELAKDKTTLGWLVDYDICNASYPCPYALVVARDAKILRVITGDRFIWKWKFLKNGTEVAYQMGFPHGNPQATYALYDVNKGKILARASFDDKALPAWTQGIIAND